MSEHLRSKLTVFFVAFLMVWPVVHIVWSLYFGLNSWKLAGWGMYGSMSPGTIGLNVYVVDDSRPPLPEMELGPVVANFSAKIYTANGTAPVSFREITNEDDQALVRLIKMIRVFRAASHIGEMAERIERIAAGQIETETAYTILLLSTPRLNLREKFTYTETEAYLVRGGVVERIGSYGSEITSDRDILHKIDGDIGESVKLTEVPIVRARPDKNA